MIEKRALIAIVICCLIYVGWLAFFAPRAPIVPPPSAPGVAAGAAGTKGVPEEAAKAGPAKPAPSLLEPDRIGAAPRREAAEGTPPVVIETDLARIEIREPGARIISWKLEKYLDHEGNPYEMISPDGAGTGVFPLSFQIEDKALEGLLNGKARFDVERRIVAIPAPGTQAPPEASGKRAAVAAASENAATTAASSKPQDPGTGGGSAALPTGGAASLDGIAERGSTAAPGTSQEPTPPALAPATGQAEEIRFVFSDGQGTEAVKTFTFSKSSYLVSFSATVQRNGAAIPAKLLWGPGIGTPTAEDLANRYYSGGTAIADFGVGPKRFHASEVTTRTNLEDGAHWVGLEEQYFAAVFISAPGGISGAEIDPIVTDAPPPATPAASPGAKPQLVTHLAVGVPSDGSYTLFVGPKDYQLLLGLHPGLADLVNFTPWMPLIGPLVGILAKFLYGALRWLHSYIGNYGLGIILLTTAIKIAFYPITQRTMVKMRAVQQQMQKVQPKIKAIQERYRKSKDSAGRAKMNEEIMALYKKEGINPMASLGGCLPLLIQLPILYGFYSVLTVSIELRQAPFFGWIGDLARKDPYYVTPILMGVSMFVQQKMAMTKVTDPQQRAQQRMMLIMPLIFTWTFLQLPSGLVLYWFTNNILGIAQQVLINRQARGIETAGATAAGKA